MGLNEKNIVMKSNITDLDMVTNCTIDSISKPNLVEGKSLAKMASFGARESLS